MSKSVVPVRSSLTLLGGFSLRIDDAEIDLPVHARRVLAYLSLDRMVRRDCARKILAERLWPDVPEKRAHASLRTALWRIRRAPANLVHGGRDRMRLDDSVDVDVHRSREQAMRLLSNDPCLRLTDSQPGVFLGELLPEWEEDWLLLERERIRQLHTHAMEALTRRLSHLGRYSEAIEAALLVIAAEPLRETAHATLIDIHLAEGNAAEACRQFHRYADLLWRELGLRPSTGLRQRVIKTPPE